MLNPGALGTPSGTAQHLLICALKSAISSLERFDLSSLGGAARLASVSVGRLSIHAIRAAAAACSSAAVVASFFGCGLWLACCGDSGLDGSGLGGSGLDDADFNG